MSWVNGEGFGFTVGENAFQGFFNQSQPDIQADGDALTGVFDAVDADYSNVEFWGYAVEYSKPGNMLDYWGDWIPNEESPWWGDYNSGGGGNTGTGEEEGVGGESDGDESSTTSYETSPKGTPGFSLTIALLTLLALIFLYKRL